MKNVAIYARVSTEHEAQISALENQVQYYDEIIQRHPDWRLVDRYIDEGITGTSINKRQSFLRMMRDAKAGKFELVITREVSRFARNIVDTLQQTRILRSYGVEVWFTEDNIWTLNDEDGELRLSIMATLAQNESKKISQRVKAGQMISFKNGKLYGNGNILGYDRVGDQMVVNKEQADTVKRIFELYLQGYGIRKIQDIMEMEKRLTSTGLSSWQAGNITRVIKNSFYCGRIEYRKQYVPDYLTQKKINNHGEIERIYVEGTHEPIISPEDFDAVQEIFKKKVNNTGKRGFGKNPAQNIWVKKVRCTCDHAMNRRVSHTTKNGDKVYTYQCYHQKRTGTPSSRLKRGLPIDGVCDNKTFQEWKLLLMGDFLFKKLVKNKQAIYNKAIEMIGELDSTRSTQEDEVDIIELSIKEIDKLKEKIEVLVDMCTEGDISREVFREKKEKLENKIFQLEEQISKSRLTIQENQEEQANEDRFDALSSFVKMKAFDEKSSVPSTIIDRYVEKIIFDKDKFTWVLNPRLGNEKQTVNMCIDNKNNSCYNNGSSVTMCYDEASTGSYR